MFNRLFLFYICFFVKMSFCSQPSFIIIGAQKSGTTSLYNNIIQHPQVKSAIRKEIHFFDWYYDNGFDWYEKCFPMLEKNEITGEATTNYFFMEHIPKKVYKAFPMIKLILILRDPVERTISQYKYAIYRGLHLPNFDRCIKKEFNDFHKSKKYGKALKKETLEAFEYPKHPPIELVYESIGENFLRQGMYLQHIKNWFKYFNKNQLLILKFEDLVYNPSEVMDRVFNFLNVQKYHNIKYCHIHSTDHIRTNVKSKTKKFLTSFFKPLNRDLESFLQTSFHWK